VILANVTKKYKLVIFDWDGTLMDSVTKIVNCVRSSAISLELEPPTDEAIKSIIGLSLEKAMAVLFPQHKSQHPALILLYKRHYQTDTTPTPLFADVKHVLIMLQQQGTLLAIATGKGRDGLDRVLQSTGLAQYFNATRTSDEALSKPSPDMLYQLLEELAISVDEALMIGDTKIDMAMAKVAGMDRIGVTMGVHNAEQLCEYDPVATVDCYQQLQQLLLRSC
jgi:phosphoglycolate phosphatase